MNLYFQDEAMFGLMTHVVRYLIARGIKLIVKYKHTFQNTYLYGSYLPVDGDAFVYELENTNSKIFEAYLKKLSEHRPQQFKIIIIDNAGFRATKNIEVPHNIKFARILPYAPELNPCEQIWAYMKNVLKMRLKQVKQWLYKMIKEMTPKTIKSTVGDHHFINAFNEILNF